jgi:hypothetical protein
MDMKIFVDVFNKVDLGTVEMKELAELLSAEIQQELDVSLEAKLKEIVDVLNSMGHELSPYGEQRICDFSYRDGWENDGGYHCKLRVAFTGIVSIVLTTSKT